MNLILRKNDSSTSLLLFIYNIYIEKNKKSSMKLSSLLEILKVFGKNETAIRMSLSRAVKSGFLTNSRDENEINYELTPEGTKAILYWNEGIIYFWKRFRLRNSDWDGKWYFINAEVNSEDKAEFFDKLQQQGFFLLNNNTWISPYHEPNELYKLFEEYGIADNFVEIYGEMKIHKNLDQFLNDIFGIEKLRTSYSEFIHIYDNQLHKIKNIYKDSAFIDNGLALPMLHKMGWDFFKIASNDALLPKPILPEWAGDKATLILRDSRAMLLEAAYTYFDKFNL